jgi:hypothetical protein
MRKLSLAVIGLLTAELLFAIPSSADPGHGEPTEAPVIADFGDENFGLPGDLADTTMPDSLAEAMAIPPDGGATRTCTKVPHNDRTTAGPPADGSYTVLVYLVPSDGVVQDYDRPTVCSDGVSVESPIGWSNHNTRRWMAQQRPANAAIWGKAIRQRTRTYSAYGKTFTFSDVMLVRLSQPASYYATQTYDRLETALVNAGWNMTTSKYVFYADLQANVEASGSSPAGQAPYGGRRAYVYRRTRYRNPSTGVTTDRRSRWGCADEGDVPPIHEELHLWSIVNPAAPDYDSNGGTSPHHAAQTADSMHWQVASTLSGTWSNGTAAPTTAFDAGADSYTSRVLAFPAYLVAGPGRDLHRC